MRVSIVEWKLRQITQPGMVDLHRPILSSQLQRVILKLQVQAQNIPLKKINMHRIAVHNALLFLRPLLVLLFPLAKGRETRLSIRVSQETRLTKWGKQEELILLVNSKELEDKETDIWKEPWKGCRYELQIIKNIPKKNHFTHNPTKNTLKA